MCNTYQEPYKGIMKHPQLAPVFCEKMSSSAAAYAWLEGFYLGLWATSSPGAVAKSLRRPPVVWPKTMGPHGNAMILRVKNACQYGYCFGPTFFANKCAQNCDSSHSATGAAYEATFPRQGKCNLTLEMSCRTGRGRKNMQYHKTMAHDNT